MRDDNRRISEKCVIHEGRDRKHLENSTCLIDEKISIMTCIEGRPPCPLTFSTFHESSTICKRCMYDYAERKALTIAELVSRL